MNSIPAYTVSLPQLRRLAGARRKGRHRTLGQSHAKRPPAECPVGRPCSLLPAEDPPPPCGPARLPATDGFAARPLQELEQAAVAALTWAEYPKRGRFWPGQKPCPACMDGWAARDSRERR